MNKDRPGSQGTSSPYMLTFLTMQEMMLSFSAVSAATIASVALTQPFDTLKTKMQAQPLYERGGMFSVWREVKAREGRRGLFRGFTPHLFGVAGARLSQVLVMEEVESIFNLPWAKQEILGVRNGVFASGLAFATIRTIIETPFELIKVRQQVGKGWEVGQLYKGFQATLLRNVFSFTSFLVMVDVGVRKLPDLMGVGGPSEDFTKGACATLGACLFLPLDYIKSRAQAGGLGDALWKGSIFTFYRGLLPLCIGGLIAEACALLVYRSFKTATQGVEEKIKQEKKTILKEQKMRLKEMRREMANAGRDK